MYQRNYYLDVLRFLGAFSVLIAHYWPKETPLYRAFHFGRFGVVLFFIISGFLIGRNLLQHRIGYEAAQVRRQHVLIDFYIRRSLRIFPLYYMVIAVLFVANDPAVRPYLGWHVTYMSNYAQILLLDMGNVSHFWSLCVEEQFYLLMPLLVLSVPTKRIWLVLIGVLIAALVIKITLAYTTQSWLTTTRGLYGNLEGLLVGILLAYTSLVGVPRRARPWLVILTTMGVLWFAWLQWTRFTYTGNPSAFFDQPYYAAFCDSALVLGTAYPIFILAHTPNRENPLLHLLAYLGKISYGIYVYHFILISYLPQWLTQVGVPIKSVDESWFSFGLCSLIVVGIAMLSWHLFEQPILRLKQYLKVLPPQTTRNTAEAQQA